jgi:hypothetical protein
MGTIFLLSPIYWIIYLELIRIVSDMFETPGFHFDFPYKC